MSFSVDKKLPINYFKEVMEDKAEMLRMYLDDLDNPLVFSPYCGYTMVTLSFILMMIIMTLPYCTILFLIWEI